MNIIITIYRTMGIALGYEQNFNCVSSLDSMIYYQTNSLGLFVNAKNGGPLDFSLPLGEPIHQKFVYWPLTGCI
uniref:Uncharacterized protein n=1 Tax=Nelumbo nucifera TaxID=4432 RepID=A0A822ZE35_NELNU|nr:TPA_asm: hypothetical protein HUJ06_014182 [Nelumbo nucifera]